MTEPMIITVDDIRKCGICLVPGTKGWFADRGLDFRDFIKNGIPVDQFLESGDALAQMVVDRKIEREGA